MAIHLVWFRNDLRIRDNLALYNACKNKDARIIGVFIATPEQWKKHKMSPKQAWFILEHLIELKKNLEQLNIPLLYMEENNFTDQKNKIINLCKEYCVTDLFYNNQYQWNETQRDKKLHIDLYNYNINIHAFDDETIFSPGTILNNVGEMYKIYTPFRGRCIEKLKEISFNVMPKPKQRDKANLINKKENILFSYPCEESIEFSIGENFAINKLRKFCKENVSNYSKKRDIPSIEGTSKLSSYLAIGVLSPRQCIARLEFEFPELLFSTEDDAFSWLNEIIWREFYKHLLISFPKLSKNKAFIDWTENIKWDNNEYLFNAWKEGITGFPIIDAAMRQLNTTGWMHNRLRMIVASFLVKDLLIDWRKGEEYFMTKLIDGDLAANNGGWQWAASTGVDSVPYFRIFNPTTQGKRFDPNGNFVRRYIPELKNIPDNAIHEPKKWANKNNIKLNYPEQIINHKIARIEALRIFDMAKCKINDQL